jgi:hypothetical protein
MVDNCVFFTEDCPLFHKKLQYHCPYIFLLSADTYFATVGADDFYKRTEVLS